MDNYEFLLLFLLKTYSALLHYTTLYFIWNRCVLPGGTLYISELTVLFFRIFAIDVITVEILQN